MTNPYAQALYDMANQEGADAKKLVHNLAELLKQQGRLKLLPAILRDVKRLDERNAKLAPSVEVANERESASALKEAASKGIHAQEAHVNPSLIKGWRASGNGTLIDMSAKRELIELYRNITAS